jgi:imidazolonepropionase-like amidohydrolase
MPSLLAAPPAAHGRRLPANATFFDGTGAPRRPGAGVLVEEGRIVRLGDAGDAIPDGARVIDLGGRTLMPDLLDAHAHGLGRAPEPPHRAELTACISTSGPTSSSGWPPREMPVPTFSCFYGVAGLGRRIGAEGEGAAGSTERPLEKWSELLVDLALYNLDQADRTLKAARAAGVAIAAGLDWHPLSDLATEILHMIHHGLSAHEALVAATATATRALGLAEYVGTIAPGRPAW